MRNRCLFIYIYLVFLVVFVNREISYAGEYNNLFKEIITSTQSAVIEYGLRISFKAENSAEDASKQLLNSLGVDNSIIREIKSADNYYIEFKSSELSGYIEYIYDGYDGKINLEVIKSSHNLELEELEHRLKKAIGSNTFRIYRYIKAKTEIADVSKNMETIVEILENNKAINVNAIDLGDSVSITAQTGEYERIKNGDTWIDFNTAVCNYESGTYLIIGTPIIFKSY